MINWRSGDKIILGLTTPCSCHQQDFRNEMWTFAVRLPGDANKAVSEFPSDSAALLGKLKCKWKSILGGCESVDDLHYRLVFKCYFIRRPYQGH